MSSTMASFFDKEDDLNIWEIGSGPKSYPPPSSRPTAFQAAGDSNQSNFLLQQSNDAIAGPSSRGDDDPAEAKIINSATGYAYLFAENVLSHPFVVLRRVCQVSGFVAMSLFQT